MGIQAFKMVHRKNIKITESVKYISPVCGSAAYYDLEQPPPQLFADMLPMIIDFLVHSLRKMPSIS